MAEYPIFLEGQNAGILTVDREGLYDRFKARCRLPSSELLRLFAVGKTTELRLGILEPEGETYTILRRVPIRQSDAAGPILRGELRPCQAALEGKWTEASSPEKLFRGQFLKEQLRSVKGVLTREDGKLRLVALPFDGHRPFLLTSLFCFAKVREIQGNPYAVFAFDPEENPVLP